MALEKVFKIPSLVRKAGQSASKAQPFYSNVDQAIANITQGTGTGAQMLAELLKTKGVAKELKDRPAIKKTLEANKDAKVTKADLERLAAENPPPQIDETALGGKQNYSDAEIEREYRRIYGNPYTSDGERIGIEEMRDAVISSTAGVDSSFAPKYAKYTIPGGENYREVLIKLPSRRPSLKNMSRDEYNKAIQKADLEGLEDYRTTHFDEPNILAHARVADRVGPNGEKILHVEEIQSDWHQAARDARKKKIKFLMKEKGVDEATARTMVPEDYGYKKEGIELQIEKSNKKLAELEARHRDLYRQLVNLPDSEKEKFLKLEAERNEIGEQIKGVKDERNLLDDWRMNSVPDAPLKQNWHELVMKRLLDDAARNGYDKVVITPGSKQAERYKLSSHIDNMRVSPEYKGLRQISWRPRQSGAEQALKFDSEGTVTDSMLTGLRGKNISDVFGKELALKIMNAEPYQQFEGLDLDVGGKGMIGFYDKILPSYLNDYGKRYGAQVGTYNLPDPNVHHIPTMADIQRGGMEMFGRADLTPEETLQVENAFRAQRNAETAIPLHSFDITPQMREEITTKGLPLYQAAPPVAIGAGAMQEEQPAEYGKGGAVKNAMNVAKMLMPRAEQEANLAKFLAESKAPMRLYHGTTATEGGKGEEAIRRFKPSREGSLGSGVYMTPKPEYSNEYATSTAGNVLPVYAQMRNPLILDNLNRGDPATQALIKLGIDPAKAEKMTERLWEDKGNIGKQIQSRAQAQGYDGLMFFRDGDLAEVVSYNPNAIKSAIGNEGTYDIINPDMNKAGGGIIKKAPKALLPKGQQAILPAAESAANLKKFLAESAIKDRLYHATPKSFSEFIPGGDNPLRSGPAVWMTPNKFEQPAAHNIRVIPDKPGYMYGNQSGKFTPGTNVMPLHSSIKNPLYSSEATWKQDFEKFGGSPWTLEPSNIQSMKSAGFDGIVYRDRHGDIAEVVAFEPTQVKSAIGNRGTYDPAEADINKAKGGQVTNDAMWMAVQNKQLRKKHGN